MFTGKSIIITGASSGLGKSLSLEFARKGAKLALFDKDLEKL
ncbi:SDR family NAD(P)-dependent oxidoreductase, partial [candidate division KSB1 bacterium]|nr:SDR family NAD(P)-dependent oxidoreductase [candidate division KSB1 bacterium]